MLFLLFVGKLSQQCGLYNSWKHLATRNNSKFTVSHAETQCDTRVTYHVGSDHKVIVALCSSNMAYAYRLCLQNNNDHLLDLIIEKQWRTSLQVCVCVAWCDVHGMEDVQLQFSWSLPTIYFSQLMISLTQLPYSTQDQ